MACQNCRSSLIDPATDICLTCGSANATVISDRTLLVRVLVGLSVIWLIGMALGMIINSRENRNREYAKTVERLEHGAEATKLEMEEERARTHVDSVESNSTSANTAEVVRQPRSEWVYSSDEDMMGRKRSFAKLLSANTVNFGFPYQGEQHANLIVQKTPQSGTNVLVKLDRGQFLCGFEDCGVRVRFDRGSIQTFAAEGPDDHSTTVLFFSNTATVISRLRRAKVAVIEATFYQQGSQVLVFNVEGFEWR